ncbi:DUF4149 domain-containing protein [Carboxydochorda subterranea]|uniref:DUF4149 domain-containing protein n=1 Tax=Carboxydichorda subterranea TaxID=3109565 RepID=A0ABZ1BUB2_9FIRM|nr:DUF4149 domain-containing protein [Limnochorda sp. L945t]WRP16238.1 DUF4149 domain-containing protein [Limnochorda sp. L945t]
MAAIRDFLYLVALAWWTGTALYFGGSATPAIFARFPRPQAGQVVEVIFPGYYRTAVATAVALAVLASWRLAARRPRATMALVLVLAMLALDLVGALLLQPRIHALRAQAGEAEGGAPLPPEFGRLHALSVAASALSLLMALGLWALVAWAGL